MDKIKYVLTEEQKAKYAQQRRDKYAKDKTQLKTYHAKPIEERRKYYQENKSRILERVNDYNKKKKQIQEDKDKELERLRALVDELTKK